MLQWAGMAGVGAYTEQMHELFKNARLKSFPKNQLIQYEGDPLTDIYLIEKGYIKNYTILDSGDTRTLFILGPGDIFPVAFSQTLDWGNYKIKYFYQSMTDVKVLVMDAQEFKKRVESDPEKRNAYLSFIASVNESAMNQLEAMKQKKAITRIVFMLPFLIKKVGERIGPAAYQLKIKITHQELADLSGVTRETTTTLVKKLEKKGAIEQKKGKFIIHREALKKVSDDERK